MTKYLIITKPIDLEIAQSIKDERIEEAEDQVRHYQEELMDVLASPLVLEEADEIEVGPEHPDYDKASDTPGLRFLGKLFMKDMAKKAISQSPWNRLLETSEFPKNLGETTR